MMVYGRNQGDKDHSQLEVVSPQEQKYLPEQDVPIGFDRGEGVPSTAIDQGERRSCWKRHWLWIVLLVAFAILTVVGGTVGGILRGKKISYTPVGNRYSCSSYPFAHPILRIY
jgi:hypothetical protein